GHAVAQLMRAAQRFRGNTHLSASARRLIGDALVPVDARDLFDQIFFNDEVEAVAGRLHDEVVAFAAVGQTQAREDILNLGFLQWQAQDPAAALETHPYRRALGQGDDLVFQWTRLPAANVHDQARHVFEVFGHMLEIHATLEAMAGLRTEFVAAGPAHDGLGPPECTFKE